MLKCVSDHTSVLPPPPPLPSHSLNFMQFWEAVQEKGSKCFVVNVMAASEPAAVLSRVNFLNLIAISASNLSFILLWKQILMCS